MGEWETVVEEEKRDAMKLANLHEAILRCLQLQTCSSPSPGHCRTSCPRPLPCTRPHRCITEGRLSQSRASLALFYRTSAAHERGACIYSPPWYGRDNCSVLCLCWSDRNAAQPLGTSPTMSRMSSSRFTPRQSLREPARHLQTT
jgi:hypothetical protein